MGGGLANQFLAVWHALKMDRAQRDVLLAATQEIPHPDFSPIGAKAFHEEIKWICGQANSLEDMRNDALHSPLWAYKRGELGIIVQPVGGLGHIRARKLASKGDILREFRLCCESARILTAYSQEMQDALGDYRQPWPERPPLPNRGDSNDKKRPPQAPKAKPTPPPQSSRE